MSTPSPTPSKSPSPEESGNSAKSGLLTLIIVSVGILLAGWGLITLLDWIMP